MLKLPLDAHVTSMGRVGPLGEGSGALSARDRDENRRRNI
jgi:hypothetical protein